MALNPSFIHLDFQSDLSLFRNLVSSFSKLNNISISLVGIRASLLVIMVRPRKQRNNRPKDVNQGMQAMSVETIRQMVIKAVLQVIENSFNPRMTAIE